MTNNMQFSRACRLLAGVAAISLCVPMAAQAADGEDGAAGGEIIVTAQKRAENIQEVPIAMQAMSGESLKNSGFTDLRDLTSLVPSFRAENPGTAQSTTFSIRGVGQRDVNPIAENAVAAFIDGTYVSFINSVGQPLYDLERIEVLKGPQGTLFGRNATGGLINIITKKPTDYLDGYVTAEMSSFNGVKLEGAVGGPLSENAAARLSVSYDKADGYLKNATGPDLLAKKNFSGRLQFELTPTERLKLNLSGRYWRAAKVPGVGLSPTPFVINASGEIASPSSEAEYAAFCAVLPGSPVPPPGAWLNGSCFASQPKRLEGSFGTDTFFEETYYELTATADWELSDAVTLTSITDYQHAKSGSSANVTAVENGYQYQVFGRPQKQFSEELRLSGDAGAMKWQAGLYYLHISHDAGTNFFFPVDYTLQADSYAAFAQVDYDLTDELTFTLGGRLMYDTKDFVSLPAVPDGVGFPFEDTLSETGLVDSNKDWNWSGRAVLTYKPSSDLTVYAGINRGVKGGGYNSGGAPTYLASEAQYKPETLIAYEAGVKASLLDNHVRLDGSVFYYDYQDYQAFSAQLRTINVDAKITGAELFLTVVPVDGLTLSGGGTYLDAKQKDVPLGNGAFSDFPMPSASKWNLQGSVRYATQVVGDDELALQFNASYQSSRSITAIAFPDQDIPASHRFDIRASYDLPGDHWSIAGFINNLSDERSIVTRVDFTGFSGNTLDTIDRPRWGGASITYRY